MVDFSRIPKNDPQSAKDTHSVNKTAVIVQQQKEIEELRDELARIKSALEKTIHRCQEVTTYLSTIVALQGGMMEVSVPRSFIEDPINQNLAGVSAIWDKTTSTLTLEVIRE